VTNDPDEARSFRVTDKRRFIGESTPSATSPGSTTEPDAGEVGAPPSDAPASGLAEQDVDAVRAQAQEYLAHLQRLQAEFDNYRKRVLKEQTRSVEQASEPVMRRLLEVMDDFELALVAAEQQPDFDKFRKGVELVYAKLADTLRAEGLERMKAEGARFDPALHEALLQSGDGDGEPVVADVLRPGYTLKGRVIRPAGVRVEREG
jgi:molecular chaperone GrpE